MGNDDAYATRGTFEAIRRVLVAFEQSDWTEIDVRMGDVRVHLSAVDVDVVRVADGSARRPRRAESPDTARERREDSDEGAPAVIPPAGVHVVTASSPGIFWCSPEPGAPPFVDVDDDVDASTTVCIIEVMKLMNHVKAGTSGRIVAVYGVNGAAVDKGSPLFAIESREVHG